MYSSSGGGGACQRGVPLGASAAQSASVPSAPQTLGAAATGAAAWQPREHAASSHASACAHGARASALQAAARFSDGLTK